jgi:hypothetical protein
VQTAYFNRLYARRNPFGYGGHEILSPSQIAELMYINPNYEHHISMQGFIGEIPVCSQLVLDIDFEGDIPKALHVTKYIESKLRDNRISFKTYFSGSKGFHVETNSLILGANSHEICRQVVKENFNYDGVDTKIYRDHGTIRAVGSINHKTGMFKTAIDTSNSLESMLDLAKNRCPSKLAFDYTGCRADVFTKEIRTIVRSKKSVEAKGDIFIPCLYKMLKDLDPPRDLWHTILYTIAKHLLASNIEEDDAIDIMDAHEFWGDISEGGYTRYSYVKIIRSVYRNGNTAIGCLNGISADAMQHYCDDTICPFFGEIDWSVYGINQEDN